MNNTQSGNVLFYILIAVALLASLMFAVSQSGRGSAKQISEERARLIASEMIEYSNIIGAAISQLRLRGCDEDQINFDNNLVTGYTNTNAPTDGFCDVFSVSGAGINISTPPEEAQPSSPHLTDYRFVGSNIVPDIQNFAGELILITNVLEAVCTQINELLNISPSTPAQDTNGFNTVKFVGNYSTAGAINGYDGELAACIESTGGATANNFYYYKVLMPR